MKRLLYIPITAVIMAVLMSPASIHADTKQQIKQAAAELAQSVADLDSITAATPVLSSGYDNTENSYEYYRYKRETGERIVELTAIILGISIPFASVILVIFLALSHVHKKRKLRYHTIELAITSGHELPDSFYESFDNPKHKSRLQSALVWMAWGLGLGLLFFVCGEPEFAAIGSIPLLVGIAKLITYFVEDRPKKEKDAEQA